MSEPTISPLAYQAQQSRILGAILSVAVCDHAQLMAALAIAVRGIPDEAWRSLYHSAVSPCGEPGCGCHLATEQVYEALDSIRERVRAKGVL